MIKFFKLFFLVLFFFNFTGVATTNDFQLWLNDFKLLAKKNGISESTIKKTLDNSKFLPKVIEYDRYQPEFYEDTKTYVTKRASKSKVKKVFLATFLTYNP